MCLLRVFQRNRVEVFAAFLLVNHKKSFSVQSAYTSKLVDHFDCIFDLFEGPYF